MLQSATGTSKGEMKDRCLIQMKHYNYYVSDKGDKEGKNRSFCCS